MNDLQKLKLKKGAKKWGTMIGIPLVLLATYAIWRGSSKHEKPIASNKSDSVSVGAVVAGSKGLESKVTSGTVHTDNSPALASASAYGPQAIASTENGIVYSFNGQTFILPKDYEWLPKGYIFGAEQCLQENVDGYNRRHNRTPEYTQKPSDVPDGDASNH